MSRNIKTTFTSFINESKKDLFSEISDKCTELNQIAQEYLDKLEFIPNEEVIQRIWDWAYAKMDKDSNGNVIYNGKNELAEDIIDGGVPFSEIPSNGSIHYSLGWATTAQDANLRSLLEFVEGRQSEWIKFKCLADL